MEQQTPTTPTHDELTALRRVALAHLYRRLADPATPTAELYQYANAAQAITPTLGSVDDLAPLGRVYLEHKLAQDREEHADLMDLRRQRRAELADRAKKANKKKTKRAKVKAKAKALGS